MIHAILKISIDNILSSPVGKPDVGHKVYLFIVLLNDEPSEICCLLLFHFFVLFYALEMVKTNNQNRLIFLPEKPPLFLLDTQKGIRGHGNDSDIVEKNLETISFF